MKLSTALARKLLRLTQGESLPRGQLRHPVVERMLEEGVLLIRSRGTRQTVYCRNEVGVYRYLENQFGINDLPRFVETIAESNLLRSDLVRTASDSKLKVLRSFRGFLINCFRPLEASLNGAPLQIIPTPGVFTYIHDFEKFIPAEDVTVVGVENGENFRYIERQQQLFPFEKVLFVSRYPQSGDMVQWLQGITNRYVHFGDFDFSGINIYLNEFKPWLGSRASFFVPDGVEKLIRDFGNRELYDRQFKSAPSRSCLRELELERLWDLISAEKKGLEQEILINAAGRSEKS